MVCRLVALLGFVMAVASPVAAQQALPDSLPAPVLDLDKSVAPQSAWVDLRQNTDQHSSTQSAPDWVEAVSMTPTLGTDGNPRTIFRIRVTHPVGDYRILFFRLFFEDKTDARPELTAWDESGSQILHSGQLGSGMVDLPTSESVVIPMSGVSAIDVEVPGDGKTIRGAYLDWMTSSEVVHPVNTEHRDLIPEPFAAAPALHSATEDKAQFGTVTAPLASETIPMGSTPDAAAAFQFGIESQPLVALLTFEIASPRIDAPPEVFVNGEDVGPVSLALPELADPGYRGETAALVSQMHFQYTGWLRAQKIIPAANLKAGSNDLVIVNGAGASASAIRSTQIQLKYLWEKSDYVLHPGE
jgi:hypothetical protein